MRAAADRVTTIGRLISFRNSNSRATRRRRRRRKRIRNKRERAMDGADLTTPTPMPTDMHHASTRPTLAFPLGTTLLLIVIFCLSGIFSCCYHWEKLRLLRQRLNHRSSSSSNDRQPQLPVTATPIGFAAAGNRDPRLLQLQQYPMIPLVPPLPSKVTTKHQVLILQALSLLLLFSSPYLISCIGEPSFSKIMLNSIIHSCV